MSIVLNTDQITMFNSKIVEPTYKAFFNKKEAYYNFV